MLRLAKPQVKDAEIQITSQTWAQTLNEYVGSPLLYYYKPRYPDITDADINRIKGELLGDFPIQGNWEQEYRNRGFGDEIIVNRSTLEAELRADEGQGDAESDPWHENRAKLADAAAGIASQYGQLTGGRGNLSAPAFDWDAEYAKAVDRESVQAKQTRYEKLQQISVQWDEAVFEKYNESYSKCTKDRNRDLMVDHLRNVEMAVKNVMREEKFRMLFYKNLYFFEDSDAEDGIRRISAEEFADLQKKFPGLASLNGEPFEGDVEMLHEWQGNSTLNLYNKWDMSRATPVVFDGVDTGIRAVQRCTASTVDWQSWFPEHFETNELARAIDPYNFGTWGEETDSILIDSWHVDRYNEMLDVYGRQRNQEADAAQAAAQGNLGADASPFAIFRDIPHRDYRFLADCADSSEVATLCNQIADGLDAIYNAEVAGENVSLAQRLEVDANVCKYYILTGGVGQATPAQAADFLIFREVSNLVSLGLGDTEVTDFMKGFAAKLPKVDGADYDAAIGRSVATIRESFDNREGIYATVAASKAGNSIPVPDAWAQVALDKQ